MGVWGSGDDGEGGSKGGKGEKEEAREGREGGSEGASAGSRSECRVQGKGLQGGSERSSYPAWHLNTHLNTERSRWITFAGTRGYPTFHCMLPRGCIVVPLPLMPPAAHSRYKSGSGRSGLGADVGACPRFWPVKKGKKFGLARSRALRPRSPLFV
jgi:hypothetical protein